MADTHFFNKQSFIDTLSSKSITKLFHLTMCSQVDSIYQRGILSRNKASKIRKNCEPYRRNVQKRGERNFKEKFREDIKDFVRLFFVSNTPMLRELCFSHHKYNELALIPVKVEIMDKAPRMYFTNATCSYEKFERFNNIGDLNKIKWDYLSEPYEKFIAFKKKLGISWNLFKAYRGAEILIHSEIPVPYLYKKVYVFSIEAQKELLSSLTLSMLGVKIRVDVKRKYFPLSTRSRKYWKRINNYSK